MAVKRSYTMPKVIILGCGISGATAAKQFSEAGYEVTMLEKKDRVGGKIHSLYNLNAEIGAVVFLSNYPVVDTLMQNKMSAEDVLDRDTKSVNRVLYNKENPTFLEKINFSVKFSFELIKYSLITSVFNYKN